MKIYISKSDTILLKKQRNIRKTIVFLLITRPATYFDITCFKKQCKSQSSRSFSELFWIVKTIHPSVTWKKYAILVRDILQKRDAKCTLIFCPDIRKLVFHSSHYLSGCMIPNLVYDYSYHVSKNFYLKRDDQFCMHDVLVMMDFSDKEITKIRRKNKIKKPRSRWRFTF